MHFLIKAKTVGGDVTQNVAQFLVQSEDLASRYQQQIFHHVLFWLVLQFFKCSLPEEKKTLLHNHQYLPVISLLDPQIKDYKLQSPRLHAKTIIEIRSLSQTYNCDYAN